MRSGGLSSLALTMNEAFFAPGPFFQTGLSSLLALDRSTDGFVDSYLPSSSFDGPVTAKASLFSSADRPAEGNPWRRFRAEFDDFLGKFTFPPPTDPNWDRIRVGVAGEIDFLRTLPGREEVRAHLRGIGKEIVEGIKEYHGTEELGFHYNLHGGSADEYEEGGGILAHRSSIVRGQYVFSVDRKPKVYFFSSETCNLFDIINESDPHILLWPSRMGSVLVVFRLDSDHLSRALAEGGAFDRTEISISFDPSWVRAHNDGKIAGIPADTFVAPPLAVFDRVKRHLGIKGPLSRDEETLAVMRYIEAAAVPG